MVRNKAIRFWASWHKIRGRRELAYDSFMSNFHGSSSASKVSGLSRKKSTAMTRSIWYLPWEDIGWSSSLRYPTFHEANWSWSWFDWIATLTQAPPQWRWHFRPGIVVYGLDSTTLALHTNLPPATILARKIVDPSLVRIDSNLIVFCKDLCITWTHHDCWSSPELL